MVLFEESVKYIWGILQPAIPPFLMVYGLIMFMQNKDKLLGKLRILSFLNRRVGQEDKRDDAEPNYDKHSVKDRRREDSLMKQFLRIYEQNNRYLEKLSTLVDTNNTLLGEGLARQRIMASQINDIHERHHK